MLTVHNISMSQMTVLVSSHIDSPYTAHNGKYASSFSVLHGIMQLFQTMVSKACSSDRCATGKCSAQYVRRSGRRHPVDGVETILREI